MDKYQNFEKYNMIECFIECHKDSQAASNLYFQRYPEREQPNVTIFKRLEGNLINFGSFKKTRQKSYNKVNKENDAINVLACVNADPTVSSRNIARDSGISRSRVLRTLKQNKYKSYIARKTHSLHPGDSERRIQFCTWYLHTLNENNLFSEQIIWTDEAHVTSDGIFNRHNNRFWSENNPHRQVQRVHQGRFGFNVWVALLNNRVLAYEIYDENLNSEAYHRILNTHIISFMDNVPLQEHQQLYFQQDGAPPHNARVIVECLNNNFGRQWIGNNGPIRWPARSPDLTPLDFFLGIHKK